MEVKTVKLTLDEARELYNSGNDNLKGIALQAYSEAEVKEINFAEIKTFEDVCKALGKESSFLPDRATYQSEYEYKHMISLAKIDLIRKALNGYWKPSLTLGKVYYPYVRFYPDDMAKTRAEDKDYNWWCTGASFITKDKKKYTLLCGGFSYCFGTGLCNFNGLEGNANSYLGLFGCKSKEIAEHMSKYFSKEIFDVCYAHIDDYKWIDP